MSCTLTSVLPDDGVETGGTVQLAELLGALSAALDLTEGQPVGHAARCCWMGMRIGARIGLSPTELSDLYVTLLVKDLGCSSNAARICDLFLTDDRMFKRGFKEVGDSLPQALGFILSHTGLKTSLAERFGALLAVARTGGRVGHELIETRCQRGAQIARRMRFSEPVARGILDLDEHWDGRGKPEQRRGEDISILARIALLAQVADVFHITAGQTRARTEVRRRCGSWFDPALVGAFEQVSDDPTFWIGSEVDAIQQALSALPPGQVATSLDDDYLDDIVAAFGQVIDAKSPFTSGHSERVTLYADVIAQVLGLPDNARRWIKRAALLHDVGKLGVSNQVLDKPGKLDADEWIAMRSHTTLGQSVLARIAAFREMARVAGSHHERLDGSGYPHGLTASRLGLETRIVSTADVFDALSADRPYRAAMPVADALALMERDVGTAFDPECFAALQHGLAGLQLTR